MLCLKGEGGPQEFRFKLYEALRQEYYGGDIVYEGIVELPDEVALPPNGIDGMEVYAEPSLDVRVDGEPAAATIRVPLDNLRKTPILDG